MVSKKNIRKNVREVLVKPRFGLFYNNVLEVLEQASITYHRAQVL